MGELAICPSGTTVLIVHYPKVGGAATVGVVATKIDEHDVEVEYFRGSGPGGQHRNKTESGVRLTHVPTGIVVTATERRARPQNFSVAWDRLQKAVTERLRPKKKRVPTKPTRASKKRRVEAKKRQGKKKTLRRPPGRDD